MRDGHGPRYRERRLTAQDGLSLYFRDYDGADGDGAAAAAVLCLAGVSRNSKDFGFLAKHLASRYRVICPDYRGRGRSDYDADWRNYTAPTYLNDIRHLLCALGLHRVHVIGTSMGGVLAMAMTAAMPGALRSVVLNDIGPEIGTDGLAGIVAYMKDIRAFDDWPPVVAHIRAAFPNLPARSEDDWLAIAKSTFRQRDDGKLVHDWDDAIVRQFETAAGAGARLWPLFKALNRVPVLAVRGAKSKVLSAETFDRMADAMPDLVRVTVTDCGHPPSLSEPHVLEAIDAHLARA